MRETPTQLEVTRHMKDPAEFLRFLEKNVLDPVEKVRMAKEWFIYNVNGYVQAPEVADLVIQNMKDVFAVLDSFAAAVPIQTETPVIETTDSRRFERYLLTYVRDPVQKARMAAHWLERNNSGYNQAPEVTTLLLNHVRNVIEEIDTRRVATYKKGTVVLLT